MQFAYKAAGEAAAKYQERNKKNYNKKARGATIRLGDRVLVRAVRDQGASKIADKWESVPYEVIGKHEGVPVYDVIQEETGERRTVHRNLLLPINSVPVPETDEKKG